MYSNQNNLYLPVFRTQRFSFYNKSFRINTVVSKKSNPYFKKSGGFCNLIFRRIMGHFPLEFFLIDRQRKEKRIFNNSSINCKFFWRYKIYSLSLIVKLHVGQKAAKDAVQKKLVSESTPALCNILHYFSQTKKCKLINFNSLHFSA
jgi:hypothetical protein